MNQNNTPDPRNRLLGPWAYFGLSLLYSIPIVGFIFLIVFSIDDSNLNRRNYTRSYWCALIIAVALIVIVFLILLATGGLAYVLSEADSLF